MMWPKYRSFRQYADICFDIRIKIKESGDVVNTTRFKEYNPAKIVFRMDE